jgi:hypothetical protein
VLFEVVAAKHLFSLTAALLVCAALERFADDQESRSNFRWIFGRWVNAMKHVGLMRRLA